MKAHVALVGSHGTKVQRLIPATDVCNQIFPAWYEARGIFWSLATTRVLEEVAAKDRRRPRVEVPRGTLRDVLVPASRERAIGQEEIGNVDALSLGEQQLFSVDRVVLAAPRFVFLERPRATLGALHADHVFGLLQDRSITYVTLGGGGDTPDDHDVVLELGGGGEWTSKAVGSRDRLSFERRARQP